MKRLIACAMIVALMGSVAVAQDSNSVLSQNAVGYVKVELPEGLTIMSVPFVDMDGSDLTLEQIMGDDVTHNTSVYVWDVEESKYVTFRYVDPPGTWVDIDANPPTPGAGTNTIARGTGFWVRSRVERDLYIMGQVPDESLGAKEVSLSGLNLISFAFPAKVTVEDAGITPVHNEAIYAWTGEGYRTYRYISPPDIWVDVDANPPAPVDILEFEPGVGYWYRAREGRTWSQVKPYDWP